MIKRPFVWMFTIMILLFLFYRANHSKEDDARFYIFKNLWQKETNAEISAVVEKIQYRTKEDGTISTEIYLKKCKILLKCNSQTYDLEKLLAYSVKEEQIRPGNQIYLQGKLAEIEKATNPGQFDRRQYYKEKGIYYIYNINTLVITNSHIDKIPNALYQCKSSMKKVYERCLPEEESGILIAMLLGDKTLLNLDIKALYQENGISHLLAISGLHISILALGLYAILKSLNFSGYLSFLFVAVALLGYGKMTGFSVSTNRAVIMMILMLFASVIGRTYDRRCALAFSGIVILLQEPFALFSCSFLLSFGALAGVEWIFPAMQWIFRGGEDYQRDKKRRARQRHKEWKANSKYWEFLLFLEEKKKTLVNLILISLSIQFATIPILLYFYYEIPLYGVLINLFVIPLASFLVILSFLGGILGLCYLPAAKFLLGGSYYLLQFYKQIGIFFSGLPGHMQILGKPALWKIGVYYILLFLCIQILYYKVQKETWHKPCLFPLGLCFLLLLIFIPVAPSSMELTMLDVGQGDCILLRTPEGENILVDGGSSSVKNVGKYRILPALKSMGIRKLDMLVMTHAHDDHYNGLLEILQEDYRAIEIKQLVLPAVSDPKEGGEWLAEAAKQEKIPIQYLSCGYSMDFHKLHLDCLNPIANLKAESPNEDSITFRVVYNNYKLLLTGDLEGQSEENVQRLLGEEAFDILKVAHHGSKNSSPEEMLQRLIPKISLISCGENNRYGHPNQELLERLHAVKTQIYRTDQCGAVTVFLTPHALILSCFGDERELIYTK